MGRNAKKKKGRHPSSNGRGRPAQLGSPQGAGSPRPWEMLFWFFQRPDFGTVAFILALASVIALVAPKLIPMSTRRSSTAVRLAMAGLAVAVAIPLVAPKEDPRAIRNSPSAPTAEFGRDPVDIIGRTAVGPLLLSPNPRSTGGFDLGAESASAFQASPPPLTQRVTSQQLAKALGSPTAVPATSDIRGGAPFAISVGTERYSFASTINVGAADLFFDVNGAPYRLEATPLWLSASIGKTLSETAAMDTGVGVTGLARLYPALDVAGGTFLNRSVDPIAFSVADVSRSANYLENPVGSVWSGSTNVRIAPDGPSELHSPLASSSNRLIDILSATTPAVLAYSAGNPLNFTDSYLKPHVSMSLCDSNGLAVVVAQPSPLVTVAVPTIPIKIGDNCHWIGLR